MWDVETRCMWDVEARGMQGIETRRMKDDLELRGDYSSDLRDQKGVSCRSVWPG